MLHAPKQTRSKKTLERILSSARVLMSSEGVDSVGITEIVAHANSSVGSFYARFDGKEDLLRYLLQRLWAEAAGRWDDALNRWPHDAPTHARVNHLVELIQEAVGPEHGLRAELTRLLEEEGRAAQTAFDDQVVQDALRLLVDETEIRHPVPRTAVALGVRFTLAAFRDRPSVVRDDALQNGTALSTELGTALRGYWGVGRVIQVGPHSDDTAMEYFDIWG